MSRKISIFTRAPGSRRQGSGGYPGKQRSGPSGQTSNVSSHTRCTTNRPAQHSRCRGRGTHSSQKVGGSVAEIRQVGRMPLDDMAADARNATHDLGQMAMGQCPMGKVCSTVGYVQDMLQPLWNVPWANGTHTPRAVSEVEGQVHQCLGTNLGRMGEPGSCLDQHGNARRPEIHQHAENPPLLCRGHAGQSPENFTAAGFVAPVPHVI